MNDFVISHLFALKYKQPSDKVSNLFVSLTFNIYLDSVIEKRCLTFIYPINNEPIK